MHTELSILQKAADQFAEIVFLLSLRPTEHIEASYHRKIILSLIELKALADAIESRITSRVTNPRVPNPRVPNPEFRNDK